MSEITIEQLQNGDELFVALPFGARRRVGPVTLRETQGEMMVWVPNWHGDDPAVPELSVQLSSILVVYRDMGAS